MSADLPMSTTVDISPPTAAALVEIARLREAGFELIYPAAGELARLQRGAEVVIVRDALEFVALSAEVT